MVIMPSTFSLSMGSGGWCIGLTATCTRTYRPGLGDQVERVAHAVAVGYVMLGTPLPLCPTKPTHAAVVAFRVDRCRCEYFAHGRDRDHRDEALRAALNLPSINTTATMSFSLDQAVIAIKGRA